MLQPVREMGEPGGFAGRLHFGRPEARGRFDPCGGPAWWLVPGTFLNVMYRYSRWVTELSGILETEVLSKGTAYESELRWWCGRSG